MLVRNICGSNGGVLQSTDFRGSPYRFSRWFNVFMTEGCSVSAVLKNRTGHILTGCASVCPDDNISATNYRNASSCYGDRCCQSSLLPSPIDDMLEREQGLDFYEIFLDHEVTTTSNSTCTMAAALIRSDVVQKLSGKLSNLSSLPTVLEWRANYLSTDTDYDNFRCSDGSGGAQYCFCKFPYDGLNPLLPYGCEGINLHSVFITSFVFFFFFSPSPKPPFWLESGP